MGRTRTIFIALACSVVLHLLGLELYARFGSLILSPPPLIAAGPTTNPAPELTVSVDPRMLDFGEATGTGIASNKSEGNRPQEAREADENQADLDRRPTGNSPDGTAQRLMPQVGDGLTSAMQSAPAAPVAPPRQQMTPTNVNPNAVAMAAPPPPAIIASPPDAPTPKPSMTVAAAPTLAPMVDPVLPTPAPAQPSPPAPQPTPPAQTASSHAGAPPVAGIAVPHSDSDSDPFMRLSGSVVFRSGRLDVQLGRKVNTVRPQLGVGGITDAMAMASPSLVVEAHIDPLGRVTEVDLPRKTGSPGIDEPTRNAVYQWTFEPTRDKQGQAIADVLFFEIDYR
jgi:hypothetical protein